MIVVAFQREKTFHGIVSNNFHRIYQLILSGNNELIRKFH